MSITVAKRCLLFTVWGFILTGSLSIANWPGDWGHSVCGAWGCGPPLQALVACHLSWLVLLIPPGFLLIRWVSPRAVLLVGMTGLTLGLLTAGAIAIHEHLTWAAQVSDWQQQFYWQRVGFVILTTVEVPLLEFTCLSTAILLWALVAGKRNNYWGNVARCRDLRRSRMKLLLKRAATPRAGNIRRPSEHARRPG